MFEFLQSTPGQAVLWIAVLLVLCAIGAYVVMWFRERSGKSRASSSELLTGFRELREEGDISGTEFRNIKSVLGQKLQEELKSSDAEGDG